MDFWEWVFFLLPCWTQVRLNNINKNMQALHHIGMQLDPLDGMLVCLLDQLVGDLWFSAQSGTSHKKYL